MDNKQKKYSASVMELMELSGRFSSSVLPEVLPRYALPATSNGLGVESSAVDLGSGATGPYNSRGSVGDGVFTKTLHIYSG